VLSAIALVQGLRPPVVQNYEVQLAGLPASSDGTVLILASDFHLGTLLGKDWLAARIDQIQAERPDIIILGGDIVEGDDPSEVEFLPLLRRLSAPLGVWAVTGNHEFHAGGQERGTSMLEDTGFHVLHDRWAELKPGLVLAGVDDLTSRRHAGETSNFIGQALAHRPPAAATVLVSHTPWDVDVAAKEGVGLMLASHTHDGQIWPFGYLVRLTHPFLVGRYEVNGMTVIVCRGTGTWGPRMRLWRRGEIIRITLRAQQNG
jgi:predicted MPP superfamily phosphohydrolase